jgi:integrase
MARKQLTDRTLKALEKKPAPKGKHYDVGDSIVPGLAVRVSETGRRTFVLVARPPGKTNPTRRAIGEYGAVTLEVARDKARHWLELIKRGIDPADEKRREIAATMRRRKNSFAAVAEDFIEEKLPEERSAGDVELDLRRIFIPVWGGRPITEITDLDVLAIIKDRKKSAPVRARNMLALLKRFFAWAIDQRVYEIHNSPCDRLKPKSIFGERAPRQRALDDAELFAFWRAAGRMPHPYGAVYKLLVLTGCRLNEVADARWSEFDPMIVRAIRRRKEETAFDWSTIDNKHLRWLIPPERMKSKNNRARAHAVPMTPDMLKVLESLPEIGSGNFVFSTSGGEKPVWMSNKIKRALDRRMLSILRARARMNGEHDPQKVRLARWTNHDLRRVIRSGLSRLRVPENVGEAVLAHTPLGIQKTYNIDDLFEQKAEALAMWANHLKSIVNPPQPDPNNVVRLEKRRAGRSSERGKSRARG